MENVPYLIVLACPIGMGLMMWMMMRGNNLGAATAPTQPSPAQQEEIAMLRAEIAALREAQQPVEPGPRP
jgi:hypothetical protein